MLTPTKRRLSCHFLLSRYTTFILFSHLSSRLGIFQWNISSFYLGAPFSSQTLPQELFCVNNRNAIWEITWSICNTLLFCFHLELPFGSSLVVVKRLYELSAKLAPSSSLLILFESICFPFSKSPLYQRGAFQTHWATSSVFGVGDGCGAADRPYNYHTVEENCVEKEEMLWV